MTERTDGSPLTNLAGYKVYQSNSLLIPRSQWTYVTTVAGLNWSMAQNAGVAIIACFGSERRSLTRNPLDPR